MLAPSNTNFEISKLDHSISLANRVSDNVEMIDPLMHIQKQWLAAGFQGAGSNPRFLTYGMGQVDGSQDTTTVASGFDIGTALGTSGFWLMLGGGALLYYMMFGQSSARERSSRLSAARQRYQREVSGIKGEYTRTRKRKGSSKTGIMGKYKECDIGPSGKVWFKGAWRKPENVEEC